MHVHESSIPGIFPARATTCPANAGQRTEVRFRACYKDGLGRAPLTRTGESMLKIGNMDGERVERLGALAAHVVEHALASGLSWDEAILGFGIAARALAAKAADSGAGSVDQCSALAERRLKSGMNQSADVLRAWLR
jgi:hypothetical protein